MKGTKTMNKALILLLLTFLVHPSLAKSENLSVRCQFIPYTHCTYTFQFTVKYEGPESLIDNVYLMYDGDNVALHPGLFSHRAEINNNIAVDNVHLRIRQGRVYFIERFNAHLFDRLHEFTGNKISMTVESQRLPLLIEDKQVKIGWVNMHLFNHAGSIDAPLATASIRMKPTKGCWLDEHSCLNYTE